MPTELDTYEIRCHGVRCDKRGNCLRFHEEYDHLMPWTRIADNLCELEENQWYEPLNISVMKKPVNAADFFMVSHSPERRKAERRKAVTYS
jgi:hypothetical protein